MVVRVERLDKERHDLRGFECESDYLTDYFRKSAWKHGQRRMNVTYVAINDQEEQTVCGYMTLSMGDVDQRDVDDWARVGLPRFPIPVLHLGMLATSKAHRGQRIGDRLIVFAMERALELSAQVGCHALQLKASDESLVSYYERRSFVRMKEDGLLMFIPMATIADAFGDAAPTQPVRRAT